MATKGRKERKAKRLAGIRTGSELPRFHPPSARLLCVLCALSWLNFGVRTEPGYSGAEIKAVFLEAVIATRAIWLSGLRKDAALHSSFNAEIGITASSALL